MSKFIIGIIVGLVALAAGIYVYVHYGFIKMEADQPINPVERFYLHDAMDKYAERYSPKANDPLTPDDATLIHGMRIYKSNCAVCHGGPFKPISDVGMGLYPHAPQFLQDAPDMPPNQNYWITKHGVARTGMPAWDKSLSDSDIWTVVTFLSKMEDLEKLSPAVQQEWKSAPQAELGAQQHPSAPGAQPPQATPAMPKAKPQGHQHDRD